MITRSLSSIHIKSNGMAGAERVKADTALKASPVRIPGLRTDLRSESAVVRGSVWPPKETCWGSPPVRCGRL